jgi:hypothetical protein
MPLYRVCQYKTHCRTVDIRAKNRKDAIEFRGIVEGESSILLDENTNETVLLGVLDKHGRLKD